MTCPESEINFANPSMNISMNLYYNCDGASILTFMAIFLLSSTEKFMILQNLPSVKCKYELTQFKIYQWVMALAARYFCTLFQVLQLI